MGISLSVLETFKAQQQANCLVENWWEALGPLALVCCAHTRGARSAFLTCILLQTFSLLFSTGGTLYLAHHDHLSKDLKL